MIWPETHEVVVSRTLKPYSLRIEVWPGGQDVEIGMQLDEFIEAVVRNMKNPAFLLSRAKMQEELKKHAASVCENMKSEIKQIYGK